jgi:anti-sigma B factor antagonist
MDTDAAHVPGLTISARTAGSTTIAELRGELDITGSPGLRDQLLGMLRRSSSRLVIDLSGVTHCDTSGLAVLVGTERRARLLGGSLHLAAVPPHVGEILRITGLDRHLDISPTVHAATVSAQGHRGGTDSADPAALRAVTAALLVQRLSHSPTVAASATSLRCVLNARSPAVA